MNRTHRTEVFDALLLKFRSWALFKIGFLPFTYIQPVNPRKILSDLNRELQKGRIKLGGKDSRAVALPVEEGLFALTVDPLDIVKLKIMPISMTWINLENYQI